jgi:hypothetical protein
MTPEGFEAKTGIKIDPLFIGRTGIKVKRVASPEETPATMAAKAARIALERAGLSIKDINKYGYSGHRCTGGYITPHSSQGSGTPRGQ